MRRKKTKVAISIIIAIVMILLVISTSAEAASFSITSGRDSVTVGESYNITITATGLTGKFNISHSQNVSVNISSVLLTMEGQMKNNCYGKKCGKSNSDN